MGRQNGVAEIERGLERALPQGLGVGQHRPRLRHRHQARALLADQAHLLCPVHDQVQARELGSAVEPQALVAGPEQRDQLPGVRGPDVPGRREHPPPGAKPIREGAELTGNLAASGRRGEFLRGRQAHRKLGEFPLLARSRPAELPLEDTPQQILVKRQTAVTDIGQEGGQRLGVADVHAAVPGGHRHRLRHPVPLLVADRVSELLLDGVNGEFVLLDGGAPRITQPVSLHIAQHGP